MTAAHAAGAVGAIIYNNIPGQELAATLGSNTTQANLVPAVGATQEQGLGYKTTIEGGTEVIGHISVYSYFNNVTT